MVPPNSWKEVPQSIGLMNYCHNIWAIRSHSLSSLTKIMSSKVIFYWTKIEQDSFEEIKCIVVRNVLLAYPYFNEEFKACTNASDFKLGAVISQNGKHITLYSIKLTGAKIRYILT